MRKNFGMKPWIFPQPVLIIASYDKDGKADAMNAAWGGMADDDKIQICLSADHQTTINIKERKAFTLSFGTVESVIASDYVGIVSAKKEDRKMEKAGFTVTKSENVDAPIINELPVCIECELVKVGEYGNIIGKIVNVNADESVLDESGRIDFSRFKPLIYEPVHHSYHAFGEKVAPAFSAGNVLK